MCLSLQVCRLISQRFDHISVCYPLILFIFISVALCTKFVLTQGKTNSFENCISSAKLCSFPSLQTFYVDGMASNFVAYYAVESFSFVHCQHLPGKNKIRLTWRAWKVFKAIFRQLAVKLRKCFSKVLFTNLWN